MKIVILEEIQYWSSLMSIMLMTEQVWWDRIMQEYVAQDSYHYDEFQKALQVRDTLLHVRKKLKKEGKWI